MSNFDRAFDIVVGHEGLYDDDHDDTGNWTGGKKGVGELRGTKYGISAAAYPDLDIASLTLDDARLIYEDYYWKPLRCDEMPWRWALAMFDTGVNMGVPAAIPLAQDALGVLTDGRLGPRTMGAIQADGERKLARFFALRALRYMKHPRFDRYGMGWLTRAFDIALDAH